MYDPTIFENIKVAFENHVYELETIDHQITIINRTDRMDFAILARDFGIRFALVDELHVTAEILLEAPLKELASEILEIEGGNPGCHLSVHFNKRIHDVPGQCKQIDQALKSLWESEIELTQTIHFSYGTDLTSYWNQIALTFKRKINEDQLADLTEFIATVVKSLELLISIE